ncbi:hypothetical protein HUW51_17960 [Adhaeribacter swui]|uniref:Prokaryotic glutathione synthetase ATP-binding domain-containing protein n=1 Tax=Adhaeribacter swui TaxID=2086471 RepID=A0A7G7GBI4_9BACT|nr:hypothetical protein [Adhaeribacter swui]QNF34518.1 hypothetical protein HUW51_17960 [Adhaeribacter swui]
MAQPKIAFITYQDYGKYTSTVEDEDTVLFNFLKEKGLDLTFEIWNDPKVNWDKYDLLLLKSPWDYFDYIIDFREWLDVIEKKNIPMLNPLKTVRWNTDKHYLGDIEAAGFNITPTLWIEPGEAFKLEQIFRHYGTEKIIIKPCVSGGAKNTFAISRDNAEEQAIKLNALFAQESFLAQPFLPEVQTQGEWSFIFFNGQFSHCLLKTPQEGDFRVQHYLGGSIFPKDAPPHLLLQASGIVQQFAANCLYARVDCLEVNGSFMLMELELIEPFLFLFTHQNSLDNYYQALQQHLSKAGLKF